MKKNIHEIRMFPTNAIFDEMELIQHLRDITAPGFGDMKEHRIFFEQ